MPPVGGNLLIGSFFWSKSVCLGEFGLSSPVGDLPRATVFLRPVSRTGDLLRTGDLFLRYLSRIGDLLRTGDLSLRLLLRTGDRFRTGDLSLR